MALLVPSVDEVHRNRLAVAHDVERDLALAEPHRAALLARDRASRPLAGNAALPLAEHVIDGGRDRGEHARGFSFRRDRLKAVGKFLGQERGREPSRLPALVRHQRREERNVVADALDGEGVERIGLGGDRFLARRRMGHELGDHRIVIERNLAALVDAGVVAHGDAARARLRRRPVAHQPADRGQEVAHGSSA